MSDQRVKKILKRELSKRVKYKTTYKDIKYYFNMINKSVFKNKLSPFNEILIKKIYFGVCKSKEYYSGRSGSPSCSMFYCAPPKPIRAL